MIRKKAIICVIAAIAAAGCSVLPQGRDTGPADRTARADSPRVTRSAPPVAMAPASRQCTGELTGSRAQYEPLPDKYYGAGCSTVNTVRLTGLGADGGALDVTNLGAVSCPLALTFAGWARYGVDRAARQILGSPLARIETFGSYSCRNIAGSAKRSAHARAEALDIGAFVLADGRRISVRNGWNGTRDERAFLRVVHRSACKRFGTVLGPDYNKAHEDHLHLEQGAGSFCR